MFLKLFFKLTHILFFSLDFYWCWFGVLPEAFLEIPKPSCPGLLLHQVALRTMQRFSDGTWEVCACVCVSVCVHAWQRGIQRKEEKKKAGHPTFEWEMFLQRGAKKNKKKQKQYFTVREMLPNKVVIAICCNTHTHTGDMHARK